MNKTLLRYLSGSLALAMLCFIAACSDDNHETPSQKERIVTFGSTIDSRSVASWKSGQAIGVFMKAAGKELSAASLLDGADNTKFVTATGSGFFASAGAKIVFPQNETVDFVAYSPYSTQVTNFRLPIDVTDQSDAAALDLLYANNATAWSATMMEASLQFSPQMATLRLTVLSGDGSDLGAIRAEVLDVPTTTAFDLRTGSFETPTTTGNVAMSVTGTGASRTATAALIPHEQGVKIELTRASGKKDTVVIARTLTRGSEIYETVRLTASGGISSTASYQSWMETPLITAAELSKGNLRYVTHFLTESGYTATRNYSMLYDTDLKMAHWVAYPISRSYLQRGSGVTGRTDAWAFDPSFTQSEQANLAYAVGGYQRGHQIASADRYITYSANAQTFYYTNMTPQNGRLNGGLWAELEAAVRTWANSVDTLFVVTGASATSSLTSNDITYVSDNSGKPIAVPKYYYKAICTVNRTTGVAKTLAFKINNQTYTGKNYMSFALSVAELERLTGYTFFPSVDSKYKNNTTW